MPDGLNSVDGMIHLLDEDNPEIKDFALTQLNEVANSYWAEIAAALEKIEVLYEDEKFKSRELAALVASKVYFHLEQYQESMSFALGAGKLFDATEKTQFVDTLLAKCIDEYVRLRVLQVEGKEADKAVIDPRLEAIVMGMFTRCYNDKQYKQSLGVAFEIRRLDKIEESIVNSDDVADMLSYAQKICTEVVLNRDFRVKVFRLLIQIYDRQSQPNYLKICQILTFLEDHKAIADILEKLIKSENRDDVLLAYQIGFDLVEDAAQHLLSSIRKQISADLSSSTSNAPAAQSGEAMEIDKSSDAIITEAQPIRNEGDANASSDSSSSSDSVAERKQKLHTILTGETTIALNMDFLVRNNRTDLLILKNIKTQVESRSSVLHTATIIANAFMHCGTTIDTFLRDNLEWLAKATNWAKFTAIAGMGIIHKGHMKEGLSLLGPYLPQGAGTGSAYSEGGSLFALGIIHAGHGSSIVQYLVRALKNCSGNEIIQHGACLGLGVASMGTENDEVYEEMKTILYLDSAVSGEAAGLAMGLVQLGSASQKAVSEMIAYAHETQHEKIIRGLAMGLSVTMLGREEEADTLIEQLLLDKDPIMRYGAAYTIGLAYCGTSNNSAIKRLLHVAVSDVSDDVRRAAVTCLGFLLFKTPEQCPKVVSLLAESYNPHVRYGACLALGISCAGTSLKEAVEILEPLASDAVDFVRQGALVALAMILVQTNKQQEPGVERVRKLLEEKIADKHEDAMCKFGAILASGIMDAGGRNLTISLQSRSGQKNLNAIVGLALFTQYWYWYPLTYFIGLAFTPTTFIGLNKDLKMPVYSFKSNAKPSLFAYPPPTTPPTTVAPQKVSSAVLSVTKKNQREQKKNAMEVDPKTPEVKKEEAKKEEPKKEGEPAAPTKKREPEPDFEVKQNPCRVTLTQSKFLSFDSDERYEPIKGRGAVGITLLKDKKPDQPEELVTPAAASGTSSGAPKVEEEKEPEPPAPFVYDPTKE
eukprot:TRINITY_DN418_c0_g1_i1.p1 TRINITY_DN418_c0_g1~~TRINITY_DN418_c0_g1_i1.p1  ORF type:complete len:986 (-),score=320.55 TRINITY_DN418_c0_g1_i1:97-3054(-)